MYISVHLCTRGELPMTKATFTEFRKHAKTYFDSVEKGETVRIIRHGKVIAEVVPPHEDLGKRTWKKRGLRLLVPGVSITKVILDERRK